MSTNDDEVDQTARLNRQRLTIARPPDGALQEAANKAMAVRENMARLRELRLAKEAQDRQKSQSATNPQKQNRESDRKHPDKSGHF